MQTPQTVEVTGQGIPYYLDSQLSFASLPPQIRKDIEKLLKHSPDGGMAFDPLGRQVHCELNWDLTISGEGRTVKFQVPALSALEEAMAVIRFFKEQVPNFKESKQANG